MMGSKHSKWYTVFPFLRWFPIKPQHLRSDFIAGVTVALVLIPQSMAYAQLAGLPPYFGLYAAFLPVIIAAMWGSSPQLSTGPVAMTSLLTASALTPLAIPGSAEYIQLAIMLAFIVGVIRILLGVFGLGLVVNFLSHPVLIGFTNAAAIIISSTQLNKLLGVQRGHSGTFLMDLAYVLSQWRHVHIPSLLMGLSAFVVIMLFKRFMPKAPGVLIAVVLTTVISWKTGFQHEIRAPMENIAEREIRNLIRELKIHQETLSSYRRQQQELTQRLRELQKSNDRHEAERLALKYELELVKVESKDVEREIDLIHEELRSFTFIRTMNGDQDTLNFYEETDIPPGVKTDGIKWHFRRLEGDQVIFFSGGEIVGEIPPGIPSLSVPKFDWEISISLLPAAFALVLIGFMEAISIAKAISARTREPISVDQELIGQGLANVIGSFSSAYPVSGSFSRSALNFTMGAKTGLSSVFTGVVVMITLMYFTPLLYHLPQAVLAAVIISAVIGLINFKPLKLAWKAQKHDGLAAVVTFVSTILFAPHLEMGIYLGAGLSLVLYLFRNMKPRIAVLGRHPDGTLRDARVHRLPTCDYIAAIRFDGSLTFVNVAYFEDSILEIVSQYPKLRQILVVGDGINQLDASGAEVIRNVLEHMKKNGVGVSFSGLKKQVMEVLVKTGLDQAIGHENLFRTEDQALDALFQRIDDPEFDPEKCPLRKGGAQS